MKRALLFKSIPFIIAGILISFSTCKNKSKDGSKGDSDSTDVAVEEIENMAFCTWKEVSVRESPSSKGKWLTSVYLAEKFEYLEETAVDSSDKKLPSYYKIKLKDGKEGWIRSDFVALDSRPAAFIQNTPIYKRPDIMTKSDKEFSQMDIVAVIGEQDDWLEVRGKPREETWYRTGWVKSDNLTYDRDDIGVAVFALRAFDQKDENKKQEELEAILENPDFEQSIFINEIYNLLNDASMVRIEIDFAHFPSSQVDYLMDYFLFEEVDLKSGKASISDEGMQELVSQAVTVMTASYDDYEWDGHAVKINYFTKVYLSLPDFLPDDQQSQGYYAGHMDDASNEDKLFAFLMHKMDRNASNIQRLYDNYKDYAFKKLSSSVYFGNDIDETVNALIETYQHIKTIPDYKEVLDDLYNEIEDTYQENKANGRYSTDGYYPIWAQWELYEPYMNEDPTYQGDALWLHSFWVRRNAEDNMETVYKILGEIASYYGE